MSIRISENAERDAEIIRLRCEELWRLEEIAQKYGISRERVRQITSPLDKDVPKKIREKKYAAVLELPLHLTLKEAAEASGMPKQVVARAWRKSGITTADRRRAAFYHNVDASGDGCHLWKGYIHIVTGYGIFSCRINGRCHDRYAHRWAWRFAGREIPAGMHVLHTCDNPACVNIEHLFLGTHQDNMADRDAKGRQACGERSGAHKLTRAQVEAARNLMYEHPNWSMTDLIQHMNVDVDQQGLYLAVTGRTWKHVPGALGNLR